MTCVTCDRDRPIVAKGQCRSCYTIEWRKLNAERHELRCANPKCGKQFTSHRATRATCSQRCTWAIKPDAERTAQAHAIVVRQAKRSGYAALREAYVANDLPWLRDEIRSHCAVDAESGCWIWGGTGVQKPNGRYAVISVGKRRMYVHRLSAMTKHGNFGDEPVVHHACHTTQCVNPDHVFPVTLRENSSEMLEREHYRRRIADLENALRSVAPAHPLLTWDDFDRTPTATTVAQIEEGM